MASDTSEDEALFARDLVASSDTELDDYLDRIGHEVIVADPENLPESLIKRRRYRAPVTCFSPLLWS